MDGSVTTRVTAIAAVLLATVAMPTASATPDEVQPRPPDVVMAALNLTLNYVEEFDPNDNVTTMKEHAEEFLTDLTALVEGLLCTDFDIGLSAPWVNLNQLPDRYISMNVPAWGKDKETGAEGIGMLFLEIGPNVSCVLYDPSTAGESVFLDGVWGVWESVAKNVGSSDSPFS